MFNSDAVISHITATLIPYFHTGIVLILKALRARGYGDERIELMKKASFY